MGEKILNIEKEVSLGNILEQLWLPLNSVLCNCIEGAELCEMKQLFCEMAWKKGVSSCLLQIYFQKWVFFNLLLNGETSGTDGLSCHGHVLQNGQFITHKT